MLCDIFLLLNLEGSGPLGHVSSSLFAHFTTFKTRNEQPQPRVLLLAVNVYNCACLQLPEDEESVPPVLQYNNHMRNKDV